MLLHTWLRLVQHLEHGGEVQLHFVLADEPVAVEVEQLEGGLDFIVTAAAAQHRQAGRQLRKVHAPIAIGVKQVEQTRQHELCALALDRRLRAGANVTPRGLFERATGQGAVVVRALREGLQHVVHRRRAEVGEALHLFQAQPRRAGAVAGAARALVAGGRGYTLRRVGRRRRVVEERGHAAGRIASRCEELLELLQ